jgi:hypothetical protein
MSTTTINGYNCYSVWGLTFENTQSKRHEQTFFWYSFGFWNQFSSLVCYLNVTQSKFSNPPHKTQTELGLQVGERLLIATHLDQSNYLANQKHGAVNKYKHSGYRRIVCKKCEKIIAPVPTVSKKCVLMMFTIHITNDWCSAQNDSQNLDF